LNVTEREKMAYLSWLRNEVEVTDVGGGRRLQQEIEVATRHIILPQLGVTLKVTWDRSEWPRPIYNEMEMEMGKILLLSPRISEILSLAGVGPAKGTVTAFQVTGVK
jgi:hypothetical protein